MHGGGAKSSHDMELQKEEAVLHRVKDQMQEYATNEGIELEDDEEARRLKIVSEGLKKFKEDSRQKEEERRKFFEQRLAQLDHEKAREAAAGAFPPPPPGPAPPLDRRDRERSRSAERRRERERDGRDREIYYRSTITTKVLVQVLGLQFKATQCMVERLGLANVVVPRLCFGRRRGGRKRSG
jgi:hypothetical protein